ncbi:hypothetical protein GQ43DRAFT_382898 [Delitschia confertaspora ATCC 74209]|uniref:Uncharacterized protein n=1 Tax=Delitschia confertaspora ATCC 74209 TaxID=1513339 RepID=A0A9P4ML23_9PLEO|nr:hypothetical protein GQ43DRAFT_382898 [Delitschia confertaspora ATCC 74209]
MEQLMEDFEIYSPAVHIVEYEHTQFKLASPLNSSAYVGFGPDVDNAWNRISYVPDVFVNDDGMKKLHKPMDSMMTDDPKTGEPGYRVGLEVFHQLHCLNLLRQATRPDHYRRLGGDLADQPEMLRGHLDHCIEILRLNLQCHSDIHAFTFHEKEGLEGPWPDYESHRVCRNFEGLLEWTKENGLPFTDA